MSCFLSGRKRGSDEWEVYHSRTVRTAGFCKSLRIGNDILPMVAETLEATATKKDAMFERIIDVVCLIGSCGCLVLIVSYMLGDNTISEQMIKYLLLMYPFYKNFQAVGV